jgi:cytoskeletal protein CcmA (bactofilin family)
MFKRLIKRPSVSTAQDGVNRKTMEPSVIAANMNVLGNVVSDGILDIDGQIDGNVRAEIVTLRPNGRVRGDLMAAEVYVHGTVDGLIKAQAVNLFSTAVVHGTIMHETITVEDGAQVDGKLKRSPLPAIEDKREPSVGPSSLSQDSSFLIDADEPQSEREIKILENLRLIS